MSQGFASVFVVDVVGLIAGGWAAGSCMGVWDDWAMEVCWGLVGSCRLGGAWSPNAGKANKINAVAAAPEKTPVDFTLRNLMADLNPLHPRLI